MKRERLAMGREDKTDLGWFNHPVRGALVPLSRPIPDASCRAGGSNFACAELERFGPDDQWMRAGSLYGCQPWTSPESSYSVVPWTPSESHAPVQRMHPESSTGFTPCYQPRDLSGGASASAFPQQLPLPSVGAEDRCRTSFHADSQLPSYRRVYYRGPPSVRAAPYRRHAADH